MLCPPRISIDDFKDLHFVYNPVIENDTYLECDRIYCTNTEETAKPNAHATPEKSERDNQFKGILVAS